MEFRPAGYQPGAPPCRYYWWTEAKEPEKDRMMSVSRRFQKIGRIAAILLVAVAFSLTLLIVIQEFGSPFHAIVSDSMAPQYKTGDAVVIKDMETEEIKAGEVIIFKDPRDTDSYIIHRVVAVEDTGYARFFTTKGDNNPKNDGWKIPSGDVVGGVAMKIPGFGVFLDTITSPRGYIACVAIPTVLSLFLVFLLSFGEKATVKARDERRVFYTPPGTASLE
jgi:signal peptidase I